MGARDSAVKTEKGMVLKDWSDDDFVDYNPKADAKAESNAKLDAKVEADLEQKRKDREKWHETGKGFAKMYGFDGGSHKATTSPHIVSASERPATMTAAEKKAAEDRAYGNMLLLLSPEQRQLIDLVKKGRYVSLSRDQTPQFIQEPIRNVFFTGCAGTGKSFTLQAVIQELKRQNKKYAVTAPTGMGAVQIRGVTLYSFAGIGQGKESKEKLATQVLNRRDKVVAWKELDVLIIDEISMLSADILEKVEYVASEARKKKKVFGGVQVIISGDFYQLPPVPSAMPCPSCGSTEVLNAKTDKAKCQKCKLEFNNLTRYAFESPVWNLLNLAVVELTKVFRQSDEHFIRILNAIRQGEYPEEAHDLLEKCRRPLSEDDGVIATKLYPMKSDVKDENTRHYRDLKQATAHAYAARDGAQSPDGLKYMNLLDNNLQAPKHLELKIGTQVLLITNISPIAGLVNGSRGVVAGFDIVGDDEAEDSDTGGPLTKPRKSTGQNAERAELVPVVYFASGAVMKIPRHKFELNVTRDSVVWRKQIPLIYGWAITIHKAQGMSLDRVSMDLTRVFASGQSYVALSRARTLEGLHLSAPKHIAALPPGCVKADPKVTEFYDKYVKTASAALQVKKSVAKGTAAAIPALQEKDWQTPLKEAAAVFAQVHGSDITSATRFSELALQYFKDIASASGNAQSNTNDSKIGTSSSSNNNVGRSSDKNGFQQASNTTTMNGPRPLPWAQTANTPANISSLGSSPSTVPPHSTKRFPSLNQTGPVQNAGHRATQILYPPSQPSQGKQMPAYKRIKTEVSTITPSFSGVGTLFNSPVAVRPGSPRNDPNSAHTLGTSEQPKAINGQPTQPVIPLGNVGDKKRPNSESGIDFDFDDFGDDFMETLP
ncbi:hypothetical protein SeLEV6574_g06218 [Synchytrium endobioticum]|uniref:ATP-dependent DNA helicase n=1 Tax=Synchytrium endobioticum TaxID=286115 RepID=A0A507CPX0_9FUNG|nr:hypothetical protein SeLEV6574_g06218 [Synchytrium endobioticum]